MGIDMNILKLVLASATVAGLAVAGVSWSQSDHRQAGKIEFPIVIADAEAKAADLFARVDSDDDEEISRAEFAAAEMPRDRRGPGGRRHFRAHLSKHSGKHSGQHDQLDDPARAERRAENEAAIFATLDTDGDGQLSAEEFGRERQRAARRSLMKTRAFEHLDVNADGVLNRSEFPGQRLARLRDLDADGNGEVSRDELHAGGHARHQHAG
jgi:Ca2+-binding EF-hand superfamily protein